MQEKAEYSKTFKAKTFSPEDLLLTFDLLKRTLVDINDQILPSESLAVPAADVLASVVPATVMSALKGVPTLLSALPCNTQLQLQGLCHAVERLQPDGNVAHQGQRLCPLSEVSDVTAPPAAVLTPCSRWMQGASDKPCLARLSLNK